MKKLIYLMVVIVFLGLIVSGCSIPLESVVPTSEKGNPKPELGTSEIDKVIFVHYPQPHGNEAYWSPSQAPAPTDENTQYKYTGIHWAVPNVEYAVNPPNKTVFTGNAIEASFDTWEVESGKIKFVRLDNTSLTGSTLDYKNVVSWQGISIEYPGAIAVTVVWYYRGSKEIVDVDTVMNSADDWSVNAKFTGNPDMELGDTSAYDVQNIMTHEAGHWLMLLDLYQWKTQKLTMYGYGDFGELQKRTLGVGDKLGIDRIY